MEAKNKILIKKIVFILICLVIISIIINLNCNVVNAELIQLKDNSPRQMMGYILKTKGNEVIVIDGGLKEDEPNLLEHIKKLGGKVDAWFLTHPHMDHVQAFMEIVYNTDIKIENIYVTLNDLNWYQKYAGERLLEVEEFFKILQNEKIKEKIKYVEQNENINIDNIKCEILGVCNPEITVNAVNNSSMVIKMNINKTSIVFLGDTGAESGKKLLETQKDKLKADIVQVAHHGQNGVEKEVYEAIQAKICLWPTPQWLWDNDSGNGYNTGIWKTIETRKWMDELGVKEHYIEKNGDTTLTL